MILKKIAIQIIIYTVFLSFINLYGQNQTDETIIDFTEKGDIDSDKYFGGKQYGMIILNDGTELLGNLEIQEDGSVKITENQYFEGNSIERNNIKSIRWIPKVVITLETGEIILGHLIRKNEDHILIETIVEPKKKQKIMHSEMKELKKVKSLDIKKDRFTTPRVIGYAGYALVPGNFSKEFQSGPFAGISATQNFAFLLGWQTRWIPDARFDMGGILFEKAPYKYQSGFLALGLHWWVDILKGISGEMFFSITPGMIYENIESPGLSGSESTLILKSSIGYDYLFENNIVVGVELSGLYSFDRTVPLTVAAIGLRAGYQF